MNRATRTRQTRVRRLYANVHSIQLTVGNCKYDRIGLRARAVAAVAGSRGGLREPLPTITNTVVRQVNRGNAVQAMEIASDQRAKGLRLCPL